MIHSDQGTQFASWAFTRPSDRLRTGPVDGRVGDCYDNAVIESFWARMQVELLDRQHWRTRVELANAIFEYLEIFHNRQRRHSALGMLTPVEFENSTPTIDSGMRIQQPDSTKPRAPQSLHQTRGGSGPRSLKEWGCVKRGIGRLARFEPAATVRRVGDSSRMLVLAPALRV